MNGTWQLWLGSGVIAALITVIGRVVELPKSRGEGRKGEGEGEKALTEAQIARQINALESAVAETARAADACAKCEVRLENTEKAFKAFIGVVDELTPLLPPEPAAKIRAAIRAAWETL